MQATKNPVYPFNPGSAAPASQHWRMHWGMVLACLSATAVLTGSAQSGQQAQQANGERPVLVPAASGQKPVGERQNGLQEYEAANAERKKKIAADSALLLKMATDLKAEVDKTNKDMLSITVIRKAEAIEKLARGVKEEMKLTVGAN
jgi:hypothetical protein